MTTSILDVAAFYQTFGVKVEITGKYPNNIFTVYPSRLLRWYEKAGGWVPYNKFCNQRKKIKKKCRVLAGLPEYFTGHKETKYKLLDIATVRPFTKNENT